MSDVHGARIQRDGTRSQASDGHKGTRAGAIEFEEEVFPTLYRHCDFLALKWLKQLRALCHCPQD